MGEVDTQRGRRRWRDRGQRGGSSSGAVAARSRRCGQGTGARAGPSRKGREKVRLTLYPALRILDLPAAGSGAIAPSSYLNFAGRDDQERNGAYGSVRTPATGRTVRVQDSCLSGSGFSWLRLWSIPARAADIKLTARIAGHPSRPGRRRFRTPRRMADSPLYPCAQRATRRASNLTA